MKSLRKLLFIGLAIALVLTSCTTEKRVYMSGYHTEWYKSKHNPDRQDLASNDNGKQTKQNQTVTVVESEYETNTVDNSFALTITDNNITASVDNNSLIIPSHKPVSFDKKVNTVNAKTNPVSETKTVISNKKALKNKLKELKVNSSSGDDGGSGALRAIGWVVLILGLLILLFASIIAGALLMLLGLVFVIAGGNGSSSPQSNTKPDNSQYVDVVYLKNGSVIRGMILEQTPNVSIKIQTKDGSIFVYKMEDVEKMTKELSK
jgi:hypothetical protein